MAIELRRQLSEVDHSAHSKSPSPTPRWIRRKNSVFPNRKVSRRRSSARARTDSEDSDDDLKNSSYIQFVMDQSLLTASSGTRRSISSVLAAHPRDNHAVSRTFLHPVGTTLCSRTGQIY